MEVTIIKTKQVPQKNNEQGWPKSYKCNFLEPGAVSYEDVNQGVALLKKESMDTWIQSFKGKPVIIDHQDVDPKNFKKKAVGYITNIWYDATDGWYWCEFLITDDEGHETISKGYSVSCSFDVLDTAPGGEWHAIKYTEEITKGDGQHLALVTSPRYEDCRIMVNSKRAKVDNQTDFKLMSPIMLDKYMQGLSDVGLQTIIDGEDYDDDVKNVAKAHAGDREKKKEEEAVLQQKAANPTAKKNQLVVELTNKKEDSIMFKLFGKKSSVKDNKIDAEKVLVDIDGEKVPLATLMNSFHKEELEVLSETDEVVINGSKVSVKELAESYRNDKKKKDDDDKKDDKKNDEDKEKEDKKEKSDAKVYCFKCGKKLDDDDKKRDDGRCSGCFPKKDDDDKKKEDEKPLPNPQTDEGDTAVKKASKKNEDEEDKNKEIKNDKSFFMDLESAKNNAMPFEAMAGIGAETREDRASRGKRFFGSKKR